MKKLYYVTNSRIPTEKAHGIQVMNMCEAFAAAGFAVELAVPKRRNNIKEDPFDYYEITQNFVIKRLWCLDTISFGRAGFWIESLTFAVSAIWYSVSKKEIFYTRDEVLAFLFSLLGKRIAWEAHMGHKNFFISAIIYLKVPIITISESLKKLYVEMGASEKNILVAPDAVNIGKFAIKESKREARAILKIDQDKKLAVYAGSTQPWKGTALLGEANKLLNDIEIMIVTGKHHGEVPLYLRSADVLILPNTGKEDISRLFTSPMKLFEYMASGVPIIAADLPSMREIVDESLAYFFTPDDPKDLTRAIQKVLNDEENAKVKAKKAFAKVIPYTWHNRAQSILNFLFK